MTPTVVVALLMLLLGIQPISTDLYLPALPTLQRELGASVGAAQLTLSGLIISFGLGQLVCGPLSDRCGRRPVLLGGLALYVAASLLSAVAADMNALIVWRCLQGLAMAASVTCARSILRDLFPPQQGAGVMSRALSGLGVLAMFGPLLGAALVQLGGWRTVMLAPALFGALTLGFVALRFRETVPQRDPQAMQWRRVLHNWAVVLRHPTFRAWAALSAFTYAGLFVTLAASSFVFIEVLGVSRLGYGLLMTSFSFAYVLGTRLCSRLLPRLGLLRTVRVGAVFSACGGLGMALLSLAGVHTLWAIVVPQWLYAVGHGIHQPCGQAGAVGPFPEKAGAAAALSGFAMTGSAMIVGLVLGRVLNGTVYPMTLGVGAMGLGVAIVGFTLVQRHG